MLNVIGSAQSPLRSFLTQCFYYRTVSGAFQLKFYSFVERSVLKTLLASAIICTPTNAKLNSKVMAESLVFSETTDRAKLYDEIVPQIESLVFSEMDLIANLANIAAVLKQAFGFFWVGFYLKKEGQLVLGPFQGPLACTLINFDQGVCGHAFTTRQTVIVPNVDEFSGHIACASASRSEIVVPILESSGGCVAVLDVDSDKLNDFDQIDADGLGQIVKIIERII